MLIHGVEITVSKEKKGFLEYSDAILKVKNNRKEAISVVLLVNSYPTGQKVVWVNWAHPDEKPTEIRLVDGVIAHELKITMNGDIIIFINSDDLRKLMKE